MPDKFMQLELNCLPSWEYSDSTCSD